MEVTGLGTVATPLPPRATTNTSSVSQPQDSAKAGATQTAAGNATTTNTITEQAVTAVNDTQKSENNDPNALNSAVNKVQEFVGPVASSIEFSIDEDSGKTVVKVVDKETDEVIRQIPSEEMLELAKALDKLQGILLKQKA